MSNLRAITQDDVDTYNRNMPIELKAELSELEWVLVELPTELIVQHKPPQWKICDRNYDRKYEQKVIADFFGDGRESKVVSASATGWLPLR